MAGISIDALLSKSIIDTAPLLASVLRTAALSIWLTSSLSAKRTSVFCG